MARWIAEETGIEGVLEEAFVDLRVRWEASEFIDDCTEALTGPHTKLDLFLEGQRRGIPITPVNTVADILSDRHLDRAGFWQVDNHPDLGPLTGPGAPFRVNHDWWQWASAPRLGAHTAEELACA